MEKTIKLGILGVGNMGSSHLKNVYRGKCPEIEVCAVADRNKARLDWVKETAKEFGAKEPLYFENAMEMITSGAIDSCLICVPHYDHALFTVECLKNGLHVMCEKPAGVYTLQAREMIAEAEKHPELSFGMMFNQRTNCTYRKVKELVDSGKYGQIRRVNWLITDWYRSQVYYDSGDWRATWSGEGGGVLLNQCPHQLDLWQWICGMPVKVHSHMHFGKWHDIEVEDDVTTYVEYANGATGVFIASTGDGKGTNRLEIQMDGAKIVTDGKTVQLREFEMMEQDFSKTAATPFAQLNATDETVETDGENPQHVGVLNAWAGNILRGTPLIAEGKEGINGLMISNAMHLSAFLNKEITLPFDEKLYYDELKKRIATSRRKTGGSTVFADTSSSYGGSK